MNRCVHLNYQLDGVNYTAGVNNHWRISVLVMTSRKNNNILELTGSACDGSIRGDRIPGFDNHKHTYQISYFQTSSITLCITITKL